MRSAHAQYLEGLEVRFDQRVNNLVGPENHERIRDEQCSKPEVGLSCMVF